eukprot:scaffold41602_cov55-Phaeocystis_antarctica.AAC.4
MSFRNEPAPHLRLIVQQVRAGSPEDPGNPRYEVRASLSVGDSPPRLQHAPQAMNSERQTSFVPVVVLAQWGWGGRGGGGAFRVRDTRADRGWRCGCASDRNALRITSVLNYNRGIAPALPHAGRGARAKVLPRCHAQLRRPPDLMQLRGGRVRRVGLPELVVVARAACVQGKAHTREWQTGRGPASPGCKPSVAYRRGRRRAG